MNILIVVPAHNEAMAIGPLVQSVRALGHRILVIDDGSQDATSQTAKSAGAIVIATGKKSGKGSALRAGFQYAIDHKYEAVIAMDGDGQHAYSDIGLFLECYKTTKADIINGNRMKHPKDMPLVRWLTNAFMSGVISVLCRQRIPDTQCGFRFLKAEVLRNVRLECTDFEIETELLIKASKKGFKITSVDIQTIYRNEVSKINPLRDTLRFITYIAREINAK